MYKLSLPPQCEIDHCKYFTDKILALLSTDITFENTTAEYREEFFGFKIDADNLLAKHKNFIQFCSKMVDRIAKGCPEELRNIINEVKSKHEIVDKMITHKFILTTDQKTKEEKAKQIPKRKQIFLTVKHIIKKLRS